MSKVPLAEPPNFILKFLRWFCHPDVLEDVEGDLHELFEIRAKQSLVKARYLMVLDVIQLLRPGMIRNIGFINSIYNTAMFYNYFKSAWRNLLKYKGFSAINIFSLSIGMSACLVIFLFVKEESSFDSIHQNNIYRLCEIQDYPGTKTQHVALSASGMGPSMTEWFSEIKSFTRFWSVGSILFEKGQRKFVVDKVAAADASFFEVFDFPLIHGEKHQVLDGQGDLVVSETIAKKFFDRTDVVGEFFEIDGLQLIISGVMKDLPENSHLQFSMVFSMVTRVGGNMTDFDKVFQSNNVNTYMILDEWADVNKMSDDFPKYLRTASGDEDFTDVMQVYLQPLNEVHLGSSGIEHDYQNYRKFNGTYVNVFILVGILILLIASVNFMNLTTARSGARAKEIGVRKAIGALKNQLFGQFMFESILLSFIALVLAIGVNLFCIPFLNNLIDRDFSLMDQLADWRISTSIVGITMLLGVLAGLYPSLHLSSFNTVKILKGIRLAGRKSLMRSSLVVFQFSLALGMIVSTLIVLQQLNFLSGRDIGFKQDHILLVDLNFEAQEQYEQMKQALQSKPNVLGVTASGQRLGNNLHQTGFKAKTKDGITNFGPSHLYVDYDYFQVYDIGIKEGRVFSKSYASDEGLAFIVNEAASDYLGFTEPLGQKVGHGWYPDDSLGTIIGVTKNFNFNSLHHKVNALFISLHRDWGFSEMSVRLNGENLAEGIKEVEEVYAQFVTGYPIEYQFMDSHINELYKSDKQLGSVIMIIATLSILIGCMGLFGLASLAIQRRIKEIGIRKVMGASSGGMMIMLSKDFSLMVLLSFAIASPVTYYLISNWLDDFAFRININPMLFVLGAVISLAIALATIGYHVIRAVNANPVKALKYE